jgi:hypothetical protein
MSVGGNNDVSNDVFGDGGETPRKGLGMLLVDIERERELLDALKSVSSQSFVITDSFRFADPQTWDHEPAWVGGV